MDVKAKNNQDEFFNFINSCIDVGESIINENEELVEQAAVKRYMKAEELAKLCHVTSAAIYKAEKEGRIPAPTRTETGKRLGHKISSLREILKAFDALPGKKKGDETITISFATLKGGSWKTTTAFQFACYLAASGFKVGVLDMDPQATMSMLFGMQPDYKTTIENTLGPYLMGHEDYPLENLSKTAIHQTRLKGCVDIIPSCSEMQIIESILTRDLIEAKFKDNIKGMLSSFFRLRNLLNNIKNDYDILVLDGTPSLGMLPMNIICASDITVIPAPTAVNDFCSTVTYMKLLRDYINSVLDVGHLDIPLPQLHAIATKFNPNQNTTSSSGYWLEKIQETFRDRCNTHVIQKHDSVIDNCGTFHCSIFETQPGDLGISRQARSRAMLNYSSVFDELMEKLVYPRWPSKRIERAIEGKY